MDPLIRVYDFHKKQFGLMDDRSLQWFEKLLKGSTFSILECSPVISPHGIHTSRFRVGCAGKNMHKSFERILRSINELGGLEDLLVNRGIFRQIVEKSFDVSKLCALGIGIDRREEMHNSKIKCYFAIEDYPEKLNQVLLLHPPFEGLADYLVHETFLFSIDICFDGKTSVEIYPFFDGRHIQNRALMEKLKFEDQIQELVTGCRSFNVSFEDGGERIFHFHPHDPARFVRLINNRQLSILYTHVQILNGFLIRPEETGLANVTFALRESEIRSKSIQNIKLYYRVETRGPEGCQAPAVQGSHHEQI